MEFDLTEEQKVWKKTVHDFVAKEVQPKAHEVDVSYEFNWPAVRKMGPLGLLSLNIPEEYGGAGVDAISAAIAIEEIGWGCGSTALAIAAHNGLRITPIVLYGSDELKQKCLEEGMRILLENAQPIARTERIPLLDATGRVLAEPITATMDVPPFPRAAMDGYAVIAQDTFGAGSLNPIRLRVVEVVHAADIAATSVTPGTCIQVATGAPIPAGADAVVQFEDTEPEADPDAAGTIKIYQPVYPRQNVSARGRDIQAGLDVLAAETRLDPSKIGALAALGQG